MAAVPLAPVAGGAATLLVSGWLETMLEPPVISGQRMPVYRLALLILNVTVAYEWPTTSTLITLGVTMTVVGCAAPIWWALLSTSGFEALCREAREPVRLWAWPLYYLHGGSFESIGNRVASYKHTHLAGGEAQIESIRHGIVLLTNGPQGLPGLHWNDARVRDPNGLFGDEQSFWHEECIEMASKKSDFTMPLWASLDSVKRTKTAGFIYWGDENSLHE